MNADLAAALGDVGGALAFGISAFALLRVTMRDTARERAAWLKYLKDNSERNLTAIHGLEKALTELRSTIERVNRD